MNEYLKRLREQFAAAEKSSTEILNRAAAEKRDINDAERKAVEGQMSLMRDLKPQIKLLTEQAQAAKDVQALGASLMRQTEAPQAGDPTDLGGGVNLGATVTDRDPGHYREAKAGGQHSFFRDMAAAAILQDRGATQRLREHDAFMRANQTTSTITGVVPPKWLADLYTTLAQQDRALANAVANYTITDSRPFSLPGQTASTVVGNQSAENAAITAGDAYDADSVTITPSTVVGKEIVSRQLLDASTPAIDQLIVADLTASYNAEIERRLGAAIRAVGSALGTTVADFVDPTSADFGYDLAVDAANAVRKAMYLRATHYAMDYDTFAAYQKLKDGEGRPIIVGGGQGPMNVIGVADFNNDGWIAGIPILVSAGMEPVSPADPTDLSAAMIHAPSVVLFESPQMSFRYEEKSGPQSIELGLWRYAAIAVRQGTRAVKRVQVSQS